MRSAALLGVVIVAACSQREAAREAPAAMREAFTSAGAELVDLAFEGTVVTDTGEAGDIDRLVHAQLMFSVGELNGDSSVARISDAAYQVSAVAPLPTAPPTYEVRYSAKLPVAWGGGALPSAYEIVLPKRVGDADQAAFAKKYGGACSNPEGGTVTAGDMFLFYRPRQAGCTLDAGDIVVAKAGLTVSTENTTSKYPEYHRVWEDGELDVVAIFGRELPDGSDGDEGVLAFDAFAKKMQGELRALQPDASARGEQTDAAVAEPNVRLTATLPEGQRLRIDVLEASSSLRADPYIDGWYDARSADADVIIYSGHAALGDNVRALMTKGRFRARKYVVMVINGCDTFAYVDDTLAKHRAALNPDDPSGTRYMDTVTNVLGAYFHSGDRTTSDLVDAFVTAAKGAPRTYRQILGTVDPTQIIVVDGEQDNEFQPGMLSVPASAASAPPQPPSPLPMDSPTTKGSSPAVAGTLGGGGGFRCGVGRPTEPLLGGPSLAALVALLMHRLRRARHRV